MPPLACHVPGPDTCLRPLLQIANADFNTNDRFSDNPPPYSVPFKTFLIINTVIGFLVRAVRRQKLRR